MKKRFFALIVAVLLIFSMTIPAFAATYSNTGYYTGTTGTCHYHAYATCNASYWNAFIELMDSTDSYLNYAFRTDVTPYQLHDSGDAVALYTIPGEDALRMGTNYHVVHYTLAEIYARYYINGTLVHWDTVKEG